MLTTSDMRAILSNVTFGEFEFHVGEDAWHTNRSRPWLQVRFPAPDLTTGTTETQHGRKWFLSPYMTKSEVVTTAFKAVLTAVEHETREQFRYYGKAIFGPHFDVDQLVRFAGRLENIDTRTGDWVK